MTNIWLNASVVIGKLYSNSWTKDCCFESFSKRKAREKKKKGYGNVVSHLKICHEWQRQKNGQTKRTEPAHRKTSRLTAGQRSSRWGKRNTRTEAMTSTDEPKHSVPLQMRRERRCMWETRRAEVPLGQLPSVAFVLLRPLWWTKKGGFTCKPHNTSRLRQNHEVDHWSNWPQEKKKK